MCIRDRFCHVQRAPVLTADVCSSFKTFLYDGFCILQIHHFCSVFCSPFSLAVWLPCRQKQEIFKSLPGSHLKNPYSAALPRSEIPPVLLCDSQHMHSGENYKEERWDYQSKSRLKLVKKGQKKKKILAFFLILPYKLERSHISWYRILHHLKCQIEETCTTL